MLAFEVFAYSLVMVLFIALVMVLVLRVGGRPAPPTGDVPRDPARGVGKQPRSGPDQPAHGHEVAGRSGGGRHNAEQHGQPGASGDTPSRQPKSDPPPGSQVTTATAEQGSRVEPVEESGPPAAGSPLPPGLWPVAGETVTTWTRLTDAGGYVVSQGLLLWAVPERRLATAVAPARPCEVVWFDRTRDAVIVRPMKQGMQ
ncbi:hypothetical protein CS0771_41300 [Catellatospora sp. IY07-71]|uniref:hypothetical protein n=1 Tax=Catellatospora sp. IY07-71 TaxID=2728827 RepID=UPI001BB35B4C|nr:hypothetical protein [Catellatospora sp. IY07-71]BCJ74586.1 hypothetical protein CS0771_41300 [Catellatospora sp. IY07-71]